MRQTASAERAVNRGRVRKLAVGVVALGLGLGAFGFSSSLTATPRDDALVSASKTSPSSLGAKLAAENAAYQQAAALPSPRIPGAPRLPGRVVPAPKISANMSNLTVTPDQGIAGSPMTISGRGLKANTKVELTWSTAEDTWAAMVAPDTANFLGRLSNDDITVALKSVTTNSSGAFSVSMKAPNDWGGIHDIYAVVGGTAVAHGGFLIARWVKISPRSGPIGTPIHITYGGLGDLFYEGGFSLLWDNHYVGEGMSTWTRGTASFMIRAAGPVGRHTIQIGNAISYLYLNVPQSPIPYTIGKTVTFTTTANDGPPPASIDWPAKVTPSVSERTTLGDNGLGVKTSAKMRLSSSSGAVLSTVAVNVSKLPSNATAKLYFSTVVGNRVDCKSVCWSFVSIPLGTAQVNHGAFRTTITVPDGLGGWHAIQVIQKGKLTAEMPFYVHISLVGYTHVVKEGQKFTVHLKGVGWTQFDNAVAVDYDNSYLGYGCGFNSNGDVVLDLYATGGPGTHIIDIYPLLYTISPSFADTAYGMVPVLTYAKDEPSLALGYEPAAIRIAIKVIR